MRRLGAVKVSTQKVPVIFEPRVARSFVSNLFEAVEGRAIYRESSFLLGKLGRTIASSQTTLIDDGTIPGLFGTHPFDDEGVATRRTPVIEGGVLRSYLLNTYSARKLGMKTTGNASRGLTGNAGVGHGNLYIEAGKRTPEEMLSGIPNGFYVTELIGSGVNTSTGDYSRGASGLWIENGKLTYAVSCTPPLACDAMPLTIRATQTERQRKSRRCSPHPSPRTESAARRDKTETKMRRYMAGLAALSSGLAVNRKLCCFV